MTTLHLPCPHRLAAPGALRAGASGVRRCKAFASLTRQVIGQRAGLSMALAQVLAHWLAHWLVQVLALALAVTASSAVAAATPPQAKAGAAASAPAANDPAQLAELITRAAQQALAATPADPARPPRLEVQFGSLDPRLKLAPCQQVQAFWPAGQRLLAQARVGLRCADGAARWQVYMPVSIRVWATAWLATGDLPAGTVLGAEHLRTGEADLLARPDAVVTNPALAYGRALARPLVGGQALRQDDLRLRQWVRRGDTVRVLAGSGSFQVSADAEALAPALEGQPVRVRTEGGRVLQGVATGERQVTVPL